MFRRYLPKNCLFFQFNTILKLLLWLAFLAGAVYFTYAGIRHCIYGRGYSNASVESLEHTKTETAIQERRETEKQRAKRQEREEFARLIAAPR